MSREDTLRAWSQRPSDTEQDRIDRTERMVREAISHSPDYRVKNATVFAKGSVKMRTNIRKTSDIDICVQASGVFFGDYPANTTREDFDNHGVDYTFAEFRKGVEDALQGYFGYADVDVTGNKAIRVRANATSSRIDADVVPAFEHRRYPKTGSNAFHTGIELKPKNEPAKTVVNWPHHNYDNVLDKQGSTYRRWRKMVRILKRMREAMKDAGYQTAHNAHSFLVESLLWNVPNDHYGNQRYEDDMANIFNYLTYNLATDERVNEWGEVNELKYLFRPQQKWSRQEAEAFISDANDYMAGMS
jgi:hypothetical protein